MICMNANEDLVNFNITRFTTSKYFADKSHHEKEDFFFRVLINNGLTVRRPDRISWKT